MVDLKGIEPLLIQCHRIVLPLSLQAHKWYGMWVTLPPDILYVEEMSNLADPFRVKKSRLALFFVIKKLFAV